MADQFGPVSVAAKARKIAALFEEARGLLDTPAADAIIEYVPEFWQGAAAAFAEAAVLRRKESEPAPESEPANDETLHLTLP